jgi:hypothetical protein
VDYLAIDKRLIFKSFGDRKCQIGSDLTLAVAESFACRAFTLRAIRA